MGRLSWNIWAGTRLSGILIKEKGAREVRGGDMMKEAEVGSCIFSSVSAWGILSMVAL